MKANLDFYACNTSKQNAWHCPTEISIDLPKTDVALIPIYSMSTVFVPPRQRYLHTCAS